ncbi:MAG: hypothetical protein IT383_14545 [Deltaproteobacteria bacterium]|nr:hypothetical protein [Deltaproteobacteria bacterium]
MLSIVMLATLQLSAQTQECQSAFGKTACGYNCMAAFGDIKCAEHPQGTCKAAFGELACGFDCTAAFGKVRCAAEPDGVCKAAFGDVVCSAPTRHDGAGWRGPNHRGERWRDRAWRASAEAPPQECKSAFGKTACGYHCQAAFGDVQCARTHLGACEVAFGKITCDDPPRWVLADPNAPAMSCLTAYGKTACGYGCQSGYGDVRCARTPNGVCQSAFGKVVCSE